MCFLLDIFMVIKLLIIVLQLKNKWRVLHYNYYKITFQVTESKIEGKLLSQKLAFVQNYLKVAHKN